MAVTPTVGERYRNRWEDGPVCDQNLFDQCKAFWEANQ